MNHPNDAFLTAERLRAVLNYDKRTGIFTWRVHKGPNAKRGAVAGFRHESNGYVYIGVDGPQYMAHRLAYLYVKGEWPPADIDHRNGVKSANWWLNLRPCPGQIENQQNRGMHRNNTSGFTGVFRRGPKGKWIAQITKTVAGKRHQIELGAFDNPQDAAAAYQAAKRSLHTFQPVQRTRAPG